MVGINYNRDIPATNNNPSTDQPDMAINTNANDDIWAIDHVQFNTNNSGTHKQTTFISKNPPAAQVEPVSVLYTNSGTESSIADLFFRNQNGVFRPNLIKTCGVFATVAFNGAVASIMSLNVTSITSSALGQIYTVVLPANTVNGTNVMVFTNLSNDGTQTWSFAANTLTLNTNSGSTGGKFYSFAILQI